MIDSTGAHLTEKQFKKNMKQNKLFKSMANRLKNIDMTLDSAYICDEHLIVCIIPKERYGYNLYIDGFKSDNKHGKIRLVLKGPDKSWYETENDLKSYMDVVNKHTKIFKWLLEQDFSTLYKVYKKTDPNIEKGAFHFRSDNYSGRAVGVIVDYLMKKYDTDFVCGYGYCSVERIITITEDFKHSKVKTGPAYFDLHIFDLDGNLINSKNRFLYGGYYSTFFVDEILNDDGKEIEFTLRSVLSGEYSKCDDTYYAYAKIDESLNTKISPFIFSKRCSERYHSVYKEKRNIGIYTYVITNEDELTKEEAIKQSKTY